jgi:hypothetical protein
MAERDSIFVSIAAYCDPMLGFTLRRAWQRAKNPERLHFGVVDQSPPANRLDSTDPVPPGQVSALHIDPSQARGPCWARSVAMSLYRGEDWYLQIDSHTDFEPEWDAALVAQAQAIHAMQPRFVISSYPAPFEMVDGTPVRRPTTQKVLVHVVKPGTGFVEDHPVLYFEAHPVEQDEPVRGFHVGAGCIFAPGAFVNHFPYDPGLYFHGEEQSIAARLFTHGWDIYHVAGLPLSHLYRSPTDDTSRPLHWDSDHEANRSRKWWDLEQHARKRLSALLCEGRNLGVYGLGNERSLDDYARFCGIDYRKREIAAVAYSGPWNTQPAQAALAPAESGMVAQGRHMDAEWRAWLHENLQRGCDPRELVEILQKAEFSLGSIRANMGEHMPADPA